MLLSEAAQKNWARLGADPAQRLKKGANKSRSGKKIYPKEYCLQESTASFVDRFLAICDQDKVPVRDALYSLAVRMLDAAGIRNRAHVRKTLHSCRGKVNRKIFSLPLPAGEKDLPGIVYQSLLTEGEKNVSGSYYTPFPVVARMLEGVSLGPRSFLDPCCGSGAFLLSLTPDSPEQLWGCDRDPVAVMIAKVNLLCRYADVEFIPRIFCCDYLAKSPETELFQRKFDCIAANPPWGAKTGRKNGSGEDSFAAFFTRSYAQLKEGGKIIFLFPESLLNVRIHAPFREMLLTRTCLNSISCFEERFTGVMTGYVAVDADKKMPGRSFFIRKGKKRSVCRIRDVLARQDRIIAGVSREERHTLKAIEASGKYDLSGSIFALGIVTGNNREKLSSFPGPGLEPVYTGREVCRCMLKAPRKYLRYVREDFQQAAKDEYYRAPEKLIYKFISREPVFAYDNSGALCLNSANILIPRIPGYRLKTVLAFLNSDLLRYYYRHTFHDVKILKRNLMQLPFPEIPAEMDAAIADRMVRILQGDWSGDEILQKMICRCYQLNDCQTNCISLEKNH